ncbi:MAG: methyltransferase domain-containing protein [Anaerolineae bacterium]|jgi:ubiquinone/menaquinone biosynthesis C-methylase UbiE
MIDYNQIASEYAQHRQVHPGVLTNLISASGVDGTSQVLEVGCGTGNYILALESPVGSTCWGVDPSEAMLTKARERSSGVHFQVGRAESLDFPDGFFDLVFSVDVIHHVLDRLRYFREAYRVLKVGGKLCTVTDSEWIIRHRQPAALYFPEMVEVELGRYPRIAELRHLMESVGLTEITENVVEFPYRLTDIRPYRDKAFSALHLIPEEAFQRGIERMARDLRAGPISCVSRYVLLWGTR